MMNERFVEADVYALLQAGLDRIDQGISVFDSGLRLVGWNQRFIDLLEFPPERIRRGVGFAELVRFNAGRGEYGPGDIEAQVAERLRRAERFLPHSLERTRPNGTILAIRGEPLPAGGFVSVYTDVTARRRSERLIREQNEDLERRVAVRTAELQAAHDKLLGAVAKQKEIAAAMRRSESRLLLVTDSLPAGIAYWNRELRCLFANRRFAAAYGFDKNDIIGRPALDVVGERTLAEMRPYIDAVLRGEDVTFEYDTVVDHDRRTTIRTWLVPEVQEPGGIAGFFILSLDITRQKQAEAAIVQAAKMEAVGQLTSGIAHDFNNLLTVVLGNLLPLRERTGATDSLAEFLDPAIEAARKGASLTQRLLSFARRQSLEPRAVDIEDRIGTMVRLLRRSLPSDIEIVTATRGRPYAALVDPHQLENALLNLALNARDAMPRGGRLTFETTFVSLGAEAAAGHGIAPGAYVRIAVEDTGGGMDAATRARVFEPFFTTKPAGDGSGLGLSMVYGFVRQSHGAVHIASESGRGTRVSIFLPKAEETDVKPPPAAAADFRARPEDLVLLVEDDDRVRSVIRRQLTDLGFRLVEAAAADEALALLHRVEDFTMLVSDIVMPGTMTGIDLGHEARRVRPALGILLMTGYAGHERSRQFDRCPFPILHKPFDQTQLIAGLRQAAAAA
jgi:PAS domain S-box-containing protein